MMPRYGSYLFRRKGSPNWWLRIQHPNDLVRAFGWKKKTERSLGTPNRAEAELLAADDIFGHKALLFARRHRTSLHVSATRLKYTVGDSHTLPDGRKALAIEGGILVAVDADGQRTEMPNEEVHDLTFRNVPRREVAFLDERRRNQQAAAISLLDRWIERKSVTPHVAKEAKAALAALSKLTGVDDFAGFTRDHVDKLARYFEQKGNKSQTVNKKIGHLRAAVNVAVDDRRMRENVFARYSIVRKDRLRREPLSEADMRKVRENLGRLSLEDQKLWKILACTGMRLSEPFEVSELLIENGDRYVIVGGKTETSERRVPIPSRLDDLFDKYTVGPLMAGRSDPAGKRFAYFLRSLQISYDRRTGLGARSKVLHSLRHRMKDRLRAAGCPLEIQYEILGHEERTVASSYGRGSPIRIIKYWIDQVDF